MVQTTFNPSTYYHNILTNDMKFTTSKEIENFSEIDFSLKLSFCKCKISHIKYH